MICEALLSMLSVLLEFNKFSDTNSKIVFIICR